MIYELVCQDLSPYSRYLARKNINEGQAEAFSIEAISYFPDPLRQYFMTGENLRHYLNSVIDNGKISVDKLRQLEKLYLAMGQTSEKLNSDLHRVMTGESLVLIARAEPEAGFAIPQKPQLRSTNNYTPDRAKLESLEVETAMVAQKLDGYFQTDERQSTTNSASHQDNSTHLLPSSGNGLEGNYQELLHRLLRVSHLSHKDWKSLCQSLQLKPNAAFERVNDWVYARCGANLLEDKDNIMIDVEIAVEITKGLRDE